MEIIPNVHPILVHFTIALTATALGTALLTWLFKPTTWIHQEGLIVSRWCLWLAALAAVATVGAGFHAFYTVDHDAVSHVVMKTHRNLALTSLAVLILLSLISFRRFIKKQNLNKKIALGLLVAFVLVMNTAWYGAELVYRYGLGVISLPQVHDEMHDHSKGESASQVPEKSASHGSRPHDH
jgi:uncharacterized membrane protein